MATATHVGPIGARQINSNLYVGQSDLTTIQKAVNVAVAAGGIFIVHVPAEYTGSDTIASITGGNASVYLSDTRTASPQNYTWNGTKYIPANFVQGAGFVSSGVPTVFPAGSAAFYYDPVTASLNLSANNGTATNDFIICKWDSVEAPATLINSDLTINGVIACTPDSSPGATAVSQGFMVTWNLSNGGEETDFINSIEPGNAGGFYWYNVNKGTKLDLLTGESMRLDSNGSLWVGTDLTVNGPITAHGAHFATCEVANSPVRTFANTADTPSGMQWPPIGIGVSTGTAWGASIDPTTLQGKLTLTTTGASGAATLTGNALNIPQYTAPAQVYPGAGIAVSTGSAWGAPLDPANLANVAYINKANTFTANQTVNGTGTFSGLIKTSGNLQLGGTAGSTATTPALLTDGTSCFVNANPGGSVYLNWDRGGNAGTSGVNFCNGAEAITAHIEGVTGNATFNGAVHIGNTLNMRSDTIDSFLDAQGGTLKLNINVGGTPAIIINGTLYANGAKNFKIPHPLDDTKELIHSCLEGPEVGVFYRGDAVIVDGTAEVTLPDYFEALTFKEDRSVMLTQKLHPGDSVLAMLAATPISKGKFIIVSSVPATIVAWEVKAVRRIGVDRLAVVRDRFVHPKKEAAHESERSREEGSRTRTRTSSTHRA